MSTTQNPCFSTDFPSLVWMYTRSLVWMHTRAGVQSSTDAALLADHFSIGGVTIEHWALNIYSWTLTVEHWALSIEHWTSSIERGTLNIYSWELSIEPNAVTTPAPDHPLNTAMWSLACAMAVPIWSPTQLTLDKWSLAHVITGLPIWSPT